MTLFFRAKRKVYRALASRPPAPQPLTPIKSCERPRVVASPASHCPAELEDVPTAEPTLAALPNPVLRYALATRLPFLAVTLVACLVGLAAAFADGVAIDAMTAVVTIAFALVAHAGINVVNDYYDARNGTDALNTERVFPFTGGSRFIQNGVLTLRETGVFGAALFAVVVPAGLWLAARSGTALLNIGIAGLVVGWAYSAPPLKLNSRGIGEVCVWLGFALVAAGADFVQRGAFSTLPWIAAGGYALMVTDILFINQFPDRRADEACGKRHWVVRLGAARARSVYVAIALVAYAWVAIAVSAGLLPTLALVSLAPAVLSARAAAVLWREASHPSRLAPAIQATIAAATLHGLLVAGALVVARMLGWE
jgi:1,4-dihydroxy-2-naphthoate octaprenyltransferase